MFPTPIQDIRQNLDDITRDQAGPTGSRFLLKEIQRKDYWKYKKEHLAFQQKEEQTKKVINKPSRFSREVDNCIVAIHALSPIQ